ncbi:MAG: tripartite tricarboxylate transporter substrate binding protein [Burkholderiales bacterium]|nr:tripartite tricarboxylate transporter substrate binding protein [Burkholderiales bacterium]
MKNALGFCIALGLLLSAGVVQAQDYPTKPVRLIVSVPPGGPADTLARLVGPHMTKFLGQTLVIDNRGGANGIIAYEMGARAPADGYTLLQVAAGVVINPSLYKNVPYDPIKDFAPISLGVTVPNILIVHPSVAANSVQELLGVIKSRQGSFAFASAGNGTSGHLALELFRLSSKTQFVHVPYKGGGPALAETIAGQVQALFSIALAATPQIKAGKVRALAISSAQRSPVAPELPTIAESGFPGFEVIGWFGWLAPAQTPRAVIGKLNQGFVQTLNLPEVRERLHSMSTVPAGGEAQVFGKFMRSEHEKWGKVIKAANIKLQ